MKKFLFFPYVILCFVLAQVQGQSVYVTKTGSKYHKETCGYLRQSKIQVTLSEAKSKGYDACSVCKPSTALPDVREESAGKTADENNPGLSPRQGNSETEVERLLKSNVTQPIRRAISVQCSATTKAGTRCRRMTKSANGRCWQHGGG